MPSRARANREEGRAEGRRRSGTMGKNRAKTKKFAEVKRILNPKEARVSKGDAKKKKKRDDEPELKHMCVPLDVSSSGTTLSPRRPRTRRRGVPRLSVRSRRHRASRLFPGSESVPSLSSLLSCVTALTSFPPRSRHAQ